MSNIGMRYAAYVAYNGSKNNKTKQEHLPSSLF